MSSIWDFKDSLFRALAAVYAAIGEESFKRQLTTIATYYGEGATYHEIESLFTKDVSAKAEQLKTEFANRHGCGRDRPLRGAAGSHRPPLLDFDDEDVSVLSPGEVETLKAQSNNSLRAPAKRPRIIEGSPRTSPTRDVPASDAMVPPRRKPSNTRVTNSGIVTNEVEVNPEASSHSTGPNQADRLTRELAGQSRKRPFSELHDPIELQTAGSPRSSTPPRSESFGYVTKNGEYRCALCLRQLPNEEDLKLHEQISREHIRSLKDKKKVIIGRQRLTQITAARNDGQKAIFSAHCRRLSINDLLAATPRPTTSGHSGLKEIHNSTESEFPVRQSQGHQDSLMDIDGLQQQIQQSIDRATSFSLAEPSQTFDKGKRRAVSIVSLSDDPPPHPNALPAPVSQIHSRPTTAQTEIGTLNTPQTARDVDSAPAQQPHALEARPDDEPPEISSSTINEIMRSTGFAIELLHAFRNSTSAWVDSANTFVEPGPTKIPESNSQPLFKGISAGPTDNATVPTTLILENLNNAATLTGPSPDSRNDTRSTIAGPGIEVHLGIKRGNVTGNGRRKDVGEPISVIVLD